MGLFSKKKKETAVAPAQAVSAVNETAGEELASFEGLDPQVVAAIAAAIYSMMGPSSNFVVRNIVRVSDSTPIWGMVSRRDVMSSRF